MRETSLRPLPIRMALRALTTLSISAACVGILPLPGSAAGSAAPSAHPAASGSTRSSAPVRKKTSGAATTPAVKPQARLFLTWNAPWGKPRATTAISAPCGDSTITDTLYLSFDPGRDAPEFVGGSATVYFDAPQGSELPGRWKRGTAAAPPVRVIFTSDPDSTFRTPWSSQGAGGPFYDLLAGRGRLRLIYAITPASAPGVRAGKTYVLARVLVPRSPAGADGCASPLCIEWAGSSLAYSRNEEVATNQGERHVTMNSPDAAACTRGRSSFGAEPWKPGASH